MKKEKYIKDFKKSKKLKDFDNFIGDVVKNHNQIFKVYKHITFKRSNSIYFERQDIVLEKFKTIYNCVNPLSSLVNDIIKTNPFINENEYRKEYRSDRLTKNYQKQLIGKFRINELERDIEANILNNNKKYSVIGTPIAYEFPLIQSDKQLPIDLITYKEENGENYLYLIELKRCNSRDNLQNGSKEMFLRAFLEITTYYSYFKHILDNKNQRDYLLSELQKNANKVGINIKPNFIVKKVILAPKDFYSDIHNDIKELLNDYLLFSIERLPKIDLSQEIVGADKKLFKIEKYDINKVK